MDQEKSAVINELWGILDAINGISDTGHMSHGELLYLGVFKRAVEKGISLGSDAIADAIYSCYADQMKEGHKKALNDLVISWREWLFFRKHYETV